MTALLRPAVLAAALLIAAGCGGESSVTSDPPTPTQTPTQPPSHTPTSAPSGGHGLPLTITRSGGIAGFMDRVAVGADGIATVSRRGAPAGRCKVDASLFRTVTSAVAGIDWSALGDKPPTPRYPDDLVIAVAANGGVARLDDPKVKALVDPATKLLADPFTRSSEPKHCRPV